MGPPSAPAAAGDMIVAQSSVPGTLCSPHAAPSGCRRVRVQDRRDGGAGGAAVRLGRVPAPAILERAGLQIAENPLPGTAVRPSMAVVHASAAVGRLSVKRRERSDLQPLARLAALPAVVLLLCLQGTGVRTGSACTIVTMSRGGTTLIGNNEDWLDPRTRMWIVPATADEYGRVLFGFAPHFIQGGINEHGLFLDANGLPPTGWYPDPSKPVFEDEINDHILAHCATVADAVEFFATHSVFLGGGKFVIADAAGESIVVEWAEGRDRITHRTGFYQISTNVPQWNLVPGKIDDERYLIAEKVIATRDEVSLPAMRAVLAATHKEWFSPTIYSYICDLKTLAVHVYSFHNFEEAYSFDLRKELAKGSREIDIPSLFCTETAAALMHQRNAPSLGVEELQAKLAEGGLDAAVSWYESVKDRHREIPRYVFYEEIIRQTAADLADRGRLGEALDLYRFNCRAFPDSADAWTNLGDAQVRAGDLAGAAISYERAGTIDPARAGKKAPEALP